MSQSLYHGGIFVLLLSANHHAVLYFRNKRMSEGALRNTHLEIKEVKDSLNIELKRRAKACRCARKARVLTGPASSSDGLRVSMTPRC